MRILCFLPPFAKRSATWLLTFATNVLVLATFNPKYGLAGDAQAWGPLPNPAAVALANAERALQPKYRIIYNDDAEIDGQSEFMRFLLYANDFSDSLQGIVYTSSEFHYRGDPNANPPVPPFDWTGGDLPDGVDRLQTWQSIIAGGGYFGRFGGYAAIYQNLRKHDRRYPTPEHLLSLIRVGNVDNVGEMTMVTPGSTLIKEALLADDDRPLWLVTGGGTNTICAALSQAAEAYKGSPKWAAIRKHIIATTHVYMILDQDPTFGSYIKVYWPDLDVVVSRFQWAGIAYSSSRNLFDTSDELNYFSAPFEAQIAQGPMLAAYPLSTNTANSGPPGTLLSDGDSPMYYLLLPNGLRSEVNPAWGGWGGRYAQVTGGGWSDIPAYFQNPVYNVYGSIPPSTPYVTDSGSGSTSPTIAEGYPFGRWIPAIQNDMLSRSQWQTADYAHANHPPVVFVPFEEQNICAAPGQGVFLHGLVADPGYHNLTTLWWQYLEAGTYPNAVTINNANSLNAFVVVPANAAPGQTIHLILQVTNDGAPPLTRYQRVVITCR
jgi:hypothetical protein